METAQSGISDALNLLLFKERFKISKLGFLFTCVLQREQSKEIELPSGISREQFELIRPLLDKPRARKQRRLG